MQVDADTVWLREEYGTRAFFPDPSTNNTQFVFPSDIGSVIVSLVVEGSPSRAHNHPASTVPVATPIQIPPHSGPSTSGTLLQTNEVKVTAGISNQMHDVATEIHEIHQELRSVLQIAGSMKVPIGLQHLIRDTFRCHICQATPLVPPVIYSRCCKRIIGCQTCVDTWYGGENGTNKSCPICRAERAFAETTQLRGMDDFLEGVMPLFSEEALAGRQDVSV